MSIIGSHCHDNGSKKFFNAKPRIMKSMDNLGWMEEAKEESEGHTVTLFRDTKVYAEAPPDLHNPPGTWEQMANYWLHEHEPSLKEVWTANPADIYSIGNEQGGNDTQHIQDTINYQRELMRQSNEAGFVVAAGGLADSTPHWDLWVEYWYPFIQEVFATGNYYTRHLYSEAEGVLVDDTGRPTSRLQRVLDELEYLKTNGIPGGIIIDELGLYEGWGVAAHQIFLDQITEVARLLEPYADMLVGFCWWAMGDVAPWYADYTNHLEQDELILYMEMFPTQPWVYPSRGYKSVVWKAAQEHGNTDWLIIADLAYKGADVPGDHLPFKRTMTASLHNSKVMVQDGNNESYVVVVDPDLNSQQAAIADYEASGIKWMPWYVSQDSPLLGLKFGHLFDYQYVLTSPFNAPRDYSEYGGIEDDRHEGADYDVVGGDADNIVGVLCLYDGEVDFVRYSSGYGSNVRIKHSRNGSTFYTRYAHLDAVWVEVGQNLRQGEPVGEIGSTGNANGEHVHLNVEVPEYGKDGYIVADVVDPAPYMPEGNRDLPPVGQGDLYDMRYYVIGRTDGSAIEVRHPDGRTETFQYQYDANTGKFYLVKNGWWEEFVLDGNFICRARDISAGPAPHYAERPGALRWYWQRDEIQAHARWCPGYMREGEVWSGTGHYVQFYYYDDCDESEANSGPATNAFHFKKHHDVITFANGWTAQDVIEAQSNTGEVFYFQRDRGMIAWRDADGRSSTIVEEFMPGQRTLERNSLCTS